MTQHLDRGVWGVVPTPFAGSALDVDADSLAQLAEHYEAVGAVGLTLLGVFGEAASLGIARVEVYTGPYAQAFAAGEPGPALAACVETARRAQQAGLAVNAGHDLSQANLGTFKAAIPGLAEVSIGHALIGEALYEGLAVTVRRYLQILD